MLCFFALARERDPAGSCIDETADEQALRRSFASNVLRDFVVQFIGSQHVAAVPVNTVEIN